MKFLIADDEEDLRDILNILITANYDVAIHQARDGDEALELLKSEGPFDLIISDYKMPNKNGYDVYTGLRAESPNTPFLLLTADPKEFIQKVQNPVFFDSITKPFDEDDLSEKIKNLLAQKIIPKQKNIHIPISLDLLRKVESSGVSLFIKLNDNHFIKALKADALFNDYEYERFKRKKISSLYIELIDIKLFISNFRRNIFSLIEWNTVDLASAQKALEQDWALIIEANQHFGWSDSIAELSRENITRTLALIERQPELRKFFDRLRLDNHKYKIPVHCYLLVFTVTRILKELNWLSNNTVRKLTFASLLHDIEMNDVMFRNKIEILDGENISSELNQPINYPIYHHPMKAAELVTHWSACPPDVDKIILQHHEKFDGTGFPQKLNFLTIFPLAAVFIIAEDLVYKKTLKPDEDLYQYLQGKESEYSRGDLKEIYQASLKVAQEISAT